jgi:hypothetical protein
MAGEPTANDMRMTNIMAGRLIPWLGIAVVAGGVAAVATYLNVEQKTQSSEAFVAIMDRLIQEQHLCSAVKRIHDGDVAGAAQGLDLLLCGDILLTSAELESADPQTRALAQKVFRRLALARPRTEATVAASNGEHFNDQLAAERILMMALAAPAETASK